MNVLQRIVININVQDGILFNSEILFDSLGWTNICSSTSSTGGNSSLYGIIYTSFLVPGTKPHRLPHLTLTVKNQDYWIQKRVILLSVHCLASSNDTRMLVAQSASLNARLPKNKCTSNGAAIQTEPRYPQLLFQSFTAWHTPRSEHTHDSSATTMTEGEKYGSRTNARESTGLHTDVVRWRTDYEGQH